MTIIVGCTIPPFKMQGDPMNWAAWIVNAEMVKQRTERELNEQVEYFCALETDARGLEPFSELIPMLEKLQPDKRSYWTFSVDDGVSVVDTGTRLRRICMGHNLVGTYAVEETDASHVLFLASDTQCRNDVIPRLRELGVPAAACHIPTYCLDGPHVPAVEFERRGWPMNWDVRTHMESCACMLLDREVVRKIKWRYDPEANMTDDPCMHHDLKQRMGEEVYSRHDVLATHWPQAVPSIEIRHTDAERTVVR